MPRPSFLMRPFSSRKARYSLSWAYERKALYMIRVFVAPFIAACRIIPIMSVLLRYFIDAYMTFLDINSIEQFYSSPPKLVSFSPQCGIWSVRRVRRHLIRFILEEMR